MHVQLWSFKNLYYLRDIKSFLRNVKRFLLVLFVHEVLKNFLLAVFEINALKLRNLVPEKTPDVAAAHACHHRAVVTSGQRASLDKLLTHAVVRHFVSQLYQNFS